LRAIPPNIAASLEPVVDVPVADVLVASPSSGACHSLRLGLHPRRDERGQVQPGVAVEHELVVDHLVGGVGTHADGRERELRRAVRLSGTSEDRVERRADLVGVRRVLAVQGHGLLLPFRPIAARGRRSRLVHLG
jgi:hypothetical protein